MDMAAKVKVEARKPKEIAKVQDAISRKVEKRLAQLGSPRAA